MQLRSVDLSLIEEADADDRGAPMFEFYDRKWVASEHRRLRVLSADIEPTRQGDDVRLTFMPRDSVQLGRWTEQNVGRALAWFRNGEIAAAVSIDGRFPDSFVIGSPDYLTAQQADELVSVVGATRDVPLANEYGEPLDASSWIELERKPCAQRCAAYTLRVSGDGSILFTGVSGVSQIGERTATISAIVTRRLFLRMAAAEWFALPNTEVAASEPTSVALHVGDTTKRVANGASALVDVLATAIDMETRSRQWTGRLDAASRSSIARAPDYTPKDPNDFEIRLKRTPCFGRCPVYTVVIHGDGSVQYTGTEYVAVTGKTTRTISRGALDEIVDRLQAIGFWRMRDRYDMTNVSDIPSSSISLRIGERAKRVVNRWTGEADEGVPDLDIHRALDEIARAIDVAVDAESWIERR